VSVLVVDEILELLNDGKWHSLSEVVEKSRLSEFKAETVMGFLAEYHFIQLDRERKKARLTPPALSFLEEIQRVDKETRRVILVDQKASSGEFLKRYGEFAKR